MALVQLATKHAWTSVLATALVASACSSRSSLPASESGGKADSAADAGVGSRDGSIDGNITYDVEAEADELCQQIHDIGCGGEGCREALDGDIEEALETSCGSDLGAFYYCLRTREITCEDGPLHMPPECDSLLEAEQICVSLDGCKFNEAACEIRCPGEWAAACTASGDNWRCKCTDGPQRGDRFELPAGDCRPIRLKLSAADSCE